MAKKNRLKLPLAERASWGKNQPSFTGETRYLITDPFLRSIRQHKVVRIGVGGGGQGSEVVVLPGIQHRATRVGEGNASPHAASSLEFGREHAVLERVGDVGKILQN